MAMGGRLHRKIQRQMGSDYHAETAMKLQIPCGEFDLRVEGRADGVIIKGDTSEVIIDEIKGILRDLSLIEQPVNDILQFGYRRDSTIFITLYV